MTAKPWIVTATLVALPAAVAIGARAQEARSPQPAFVIDSLAGRDNFDHYCAPCHDRDGRGAGPVAPSLKTPPADLTTLARRNGGVFPRERVAALMRGPAQKGAHGSTEMPVWGPIFRELDASDLRARLRIDGVISYVEKLQRPADR
jgi:hypothetical protein